MVRSFLLAHRRFLSLRSDGMKGDTGEIFEAGSTHRSHQADEWTNPPKQHTGSP